MGSDIRLSGVRYPQARPEIVLLPAGEERASTFWEKSQHLTLGLIVLGLLAVLYAPILRGLVAQWWADPEYSHGFFIPALSLLVLYRKREELKRCHLQAANTGFILMLGAAGLLILGVLGAELFITRISLLLFLSGIILFVAGWEILRSMLFPLSYLGFMIPIPVILYNEITFPLQLLASRLAEVFLEVLRIPVLREGNILSFSNYSLEVVEACSGMRSLLALASLVVAYGYFVEKRVWIRILLLALMVPTAIFSNSIRIVGTGIAAHYVGVDAATSFLHDFSSLVVFVLALLIVFACHVALRGADRLLSRHA